MKLWRKMKKSRQMKILHQFQLPKYSSKLQHLLPQPTKYTGPMPKKEANYQKQIWFQTKATKNKAEYQWSASVCRATTPPYWKVVITWACRQSQWVEASWTSHRQTDQGAQQVRDHKVAKARAYDPIEAPLVNIKFKNRETILWSLRV